MNRHLLLLVLLCLALPANANPHHHKKHQKDKELASSVLTQTHAPKLASSIALIYDENDQRALYSKNAENVAPIASITKLMTAMVVLDANLAMDEKLTISAGDADLQKNAQSRMRVGISLPRAEMM